MIRSDYSWVVLATAIVHVTDHNLGNKSVTNDAENVIADLHKEIDLTGMYVQYTDSEGQVDRLLHKDGVFTGFAPGPWNIADIVHSRKGKFRAHVTEVDDEWADAEILEGSAAYLASPDAMPGDTIRVRKSLATITYLTGEA